MGAKKDRAVLTRASLLARLKDTADHKSWQDFFDTYWRLIHDLAIKSGLTESEAQDVVQETIISISKHMGDFKYDPKIGSFKSWLLKTARWRIIDQFRKRQKFVIEEEVSHETIEGIEKMDIEGIHAHSDLEKLWAKEWEDNLLEVATEKARRRLSPKSYQVFDIYVNKGWSPEKVAKRLSISVDQVYLAKHRVTVAIKQEVERLQKEII